LAQQMIFSSILEEGKDSVSFIVRMCIMKWIIAIALVAGHLRPPTPTNLSATLTLSRDSFSFVQVN